MLKYSQLDICNGGPWFGSLAIPGLPIGSILPKQEIISRIAHGTDEENIALTGGEPLDHPEIEELIGLLRDTGYKRIMARTNGCRLTDMPFLLSVLEVGVTHFEVIVHGLTSNSDNTRRLPPLKSREYYSGMRNIRRISEWNESFTSIYLAMVIPIQSNNHENLIALLDGVLRSIEVDRVVFCWGEPGFPVWRAGRNIEKAIAFCAGKGVWAVTRGIPACVVPEAACHLEELFLNGHLKRLLHLPPLCGKCSLHRLCERMPGTDLDYSWEPKPISQNRHSPFIIDVLEKGFVFDETNAHLYEK